MLEYPSITLGLMKAAMPYDTWRSTAAPVKPYAECSTIAVNMMAVFTIISKSLGKFPS